MKKSIFNLKQVGEEKVLTKTGKQKMQFGCPVTRPIYNWIATEMEVEKIECDGETFYTCVEEPDEWNRANRPNIRTMYDEEGRPLHGLFNFGHYGQALHTGGVAYDVNRKSIVTYCTGWNGATWRGHGARLVKLEPADLEALKS